jgi:hypothetical protein
MGRCDEANGCRRTFDRFLVTEMTAAPYYRRERIARGSFEKWKKSLG